MPVNEEPATAVDRAAKAAMDVIESELRKVVPARHILIIIDGLDTPEGGPSATVAGHGYEDNREVLAELLLHAEEVGKELGVVVNVIMPPVAGQG